MFNFLWPGLSSAVIFAPHLAHGYSPRSGYVDRLIGDIGSPQGPILVVIAGIHGNEPAGVKGLERLFAALDKKRADLSGRLVGIRGNLKALELGERFLQEDLNRMWTVDRVHQAVNAKGSKAEEMEQHELFRTIIEVLRKSNGHAYFLDLHTTSAPAPPFINMNDTLDNRRFAAHFPIHTILGIEEVLDGPLLGFMNECGYSSLGFEAGQHEDPRSIDLSYHFVAWASQAIGLLNVEDLPEAKGHYRALSRAMDEEPKTFEVRRRQAVEPKDGFQMEPGFMSFQKVEKGQVLARTHEGVLEANEDARVFMPLYQSQGGDGFFLIRPVSPFWLQMSSWLRRWDMQQVLRLLPGVKRSKRTPQGLLVDKKTARFLSLQLFHLLGYRRTRAEGHKTEFIKRTVNPEDLEAWM